MRFSLSALFWITLVVAELCSICISVPQPAWEAGRWIDRPPTGDEVMGRIMELTVLAGCVSPLLFRSSTRQIHFDDAVMGVRLSQARRAPQPRHRLTGRLRLRI
jgi:hypothetical protein